ncbi:hypothetical protein RJ55_02813 [Drechmeria coniospora]|nr:hypothetical protein RJ55_02813 [Drechmeria coniospora]
MVTPYERAPSKTQIRRNRIPRVPGSPCSAHTWNMASEGDDGWTAVAQRPFPAPTPRDQGRQAVGLRSRRQRRPFFLAHPKGRVGRGDTIRASIQPFIRSLIDSGDLGGFEKALSRVRNKWPQLRSTDWPAATSRLSSYQRQDSACDLLPVHPLAPKLVPYCLLLLRGRSAPLEGCLLPVGCHGGHMCSRRIPIVALETVIVRGASQGYDESLMGGSGSASSG